MNLTSHEPLRRLPRLHRELSRLVYPDTELRNDADFSSWFQSDWTPSVDITEAADRFVIEADLPGMSPDDIDITTDRDTLTIRGERTAREEESGSGRYRRVERARGTFVRRFVLPDTADTDQISARSDDGVLRVEVMKGDKAKPRKIKVDAR